YMPLDPTFPEERLLFMTADAGVDTILTVNALADGVLPGFEGRILDAESLAMRADSLYDPAHPVGESMVSDLDSPFVVLYTSGSTGRPKGVTLTKGNLLNFCGDYIELAALTPADRVPAYANFGFDAHMMDIYPTLMAGGRLYVLDEELRHDLDAMHDYFLEHRISAAFLTTQIAWQMITLYEFPDLRWLACGGEKLPPTGQLPFRFANVYGPTECSVLTTCHIPDGATDGTVIGRPLPGYEVRVLDRWQRRVPRGVPGELVIMGPSVGAGYLNRPDLTAEKFITIEGIPAYRTGDLVRWNEDGEIRFMGRMDGMVKMRGLRIELGEIEAVATRHEAVRQFAAAVKEVGGNDQLVGYYSVREGMDVSPEELREFMAADLTEFMIPTAVIRLDLLPMNQNGKIDRKALPVPEMEISEEIVAPSTPEEHRIAGYVAEVLGHDSFGVTTNLLKVGLTSLLTMRLVATIAKRLNVRISSKEAMAEPTVRGLVSAIAAASGGDESASGAATLSRPIRKYYPITENQRGILIDWERNRDALQYNVAQAIRILPDADLGRLREAIATAVKAHPALGSRFINRNGDIMQERRPVQEVLIEEITLDHTPDVKDMQALMRPFDLFGEPLYRFAIVRHADEAWLFMDFHHIVFDGVSAMVFFNTLSEAYAGGEVAAEEYSAFEWADDEAALLRSSEYEEAEQWFTTLLEQTETTVYPHSSVAEPVTPGTLMRYAVEVDAAAIDSFCSRHALTPSNFFLALFMQTLHRLTRNEKVVITTVNNGRNDVRLMDDVGMFVKTLPVVSAVSPAQAAELSPAAMALALQEQFNTTRGFDFYPFTEMVRRFDLRPEIMYVYEGGISLDATSGPLSTHKIPLALDTAKVPLTLLIFTPEPGQYRMELEFDASLYKT
ncbi:MAG: AMP-binding protein, partial [Muribaculaceae bacterium]|nr:AMP-binding protein [Muribaculaceae bacterium]